MASTTFFYALIIVGGLIAFFLFLNKGQTCASCSENFTQKQTQKSVVSSKEAEYRKNKRKELGLYHDYVPAVSSDDKVVDVVSTYSEPWPGYNKLSLYSPKVSPPNTEGYPYMNSPYDQVMDGCSSRCSDKKCQAGCVFHTLAETLPPIHQIS